jgi:hypothetical protein
VRRIAIEGVSPVVEHGSHPAKAVATIGTVIRG